MFVEIVTTKAFVALAWRGWGAGGGQSGGGEGAESRGESGGGESGGRESAGGRAGEGVNQSTSPNQCGFIKLPFWPASLTVFPKTLSL